VAVFPQLGHSISLPPTGNSGLAGNMKLIIVASSPIAECVKGNPQTEQFRNQLATGAPNANVCFHTAQGHIGKPLRGKPYLAEPRLRSIVVIIDVNEGRDTALHDSLAVGNPSRQILRAVHDNLVPGLRQLLDPFSVT
jgi:hypothetical protein